MMFGIVDAATIWTDESFLEIQQISRHGMKIIRNFCQPCLLSFPKDFQKKRDYDHRHHAMDALVIACATRNHVNLLNNQSAKSDTKRYDLKKETDEIWESCLQSNANRRENWKRSSKQFLKPWENFTFEAKSSFGNYCCKLSNKTFVSSIKLQIITKNG